MKRFLSRGLNLGSSDWRQASCCWDEPVSFALTMWDRSFQELSVSYNDIRSTFMSVYSIFSMCLRNDIRFSCSVSPLRWMYHKLSD